MSTKEMLKKEIDTLKDDEVRELQKLLRAVKRRANRKRGPIPTLDLKGQYDNVDVRKIAYE